MPDQEPLTKSRLWIVDGQIVEETYEPVVYDPRDFWDPLDDPDYVERCLSRDA